MTNYYKTLPYRDLYQINQMIKAPLKGNIKVEFDDSVDIKAV